MATGSTAGAPARRLGGGAVAVLTALSFSIGVVLARVAYDDGSNAITVLALRCVVAVAGLLALLRLTGRPVRLSRRLVLQALGIGAIMAVYTAGYLSSFQFIPVSLAVLIFYANPLLIGIGARLFDREPLTFAKGTALVLGFAGVALAVRTEFAGLDWRGLALATVGAVGVAASSLASRRVLARVDSTTLSFYANLVAVVAFVGAGTASGAFALPESAIGWAALAAVPFFFTLGITAYFASISMIGPVRTATIMNAEPVATVLLAVLALRESLSPVQYLGAALVFAAIILVQRRPARPETMPPAP